MKISGWGLFSAKTMALAFLILVSALLMAFIALQPVYREYRSEELICMDERSLIRLLNLYNGPRDVALVNCSICIELEYGEKVKVILSTEGLIHEISDKGSFKAACLPEDYIVLEPHGNCCVRILANFIAEERPYLILSIPAFILCIIGSVLLFATIMLRLAAGFIARKT